MKLFFGLLLCSFVSLFAGDEYRNKTFTKYDNFFRSSFFIEDFSGSYFNDINFSESKARYSDFFYARCRKTNFYKTNLSNSEFRFSDCRGAIFRESILVKVWLWNGDYRGADFTNANLKDSIVFDWKIGFDGEEKTIVEGTNFEGVWGLTNIQKQYLRENGAINVPEDCDEKEESRKFKEKLDKINEELFIFYPLNRWAKGSFRLTKKAFKWLLDNLG